MDDLQQVLHHGERIGAAVVKLAQPRQRLGDGSAHHLLEQVEHAAAIGQAQHGTDRLRRDRSFLAVGDGLIQERQPVAHRAFGGARDQRQRGGLDLHILLRRDALQMGDQFARFDAAQIEALAARQHRHRHLADFGGSEDELHMRRRFLQRFEQTIEGLLGQHMHFVDDVDLGARAGRGVAHALDDLAHVVDAGARGRVHFLHIDMAGFGDGDARLAHAAGMNGGVGPLAVRPDAVERPGDDARGGRLAYAANARQHEGMGDPPGGEGVGQGADQRLLADQAGEILRAVFARQHLVLGAARAGAGRPEAQGWFLRLVHAGVRRGVRWETGDDPGRIRYGCFLPNLTGLATGPSATNLPDIV